MKVQISRDSVGPFGSRLTTWILTYPRYVHAELMTHRVFSRSSASSRAIPTKKLIERIQNDPVFPAEWGKNQAGMQSYSLLSDNEAELARAVWVQLREQAIDGCLKLHEIGLHKQWANRVIETWMDITVVVSATEFGNWFGLRDTTLAMPDLRDLAHGMRETYRESTPTELKDGEWHLPLTPDIDDLRNHYNEKQVCMISSARAARTSYLTHDGDRDPEEDLDLSARILKPGHMAPFEHVGEALSHANWVERSTEAMRAWIFDRVPVGNFWGWTQFRKTLPQEHDFSLCT
jgi:hypothetical protein